MLHLLCPECRHYCFWFLWHTTITNWITWEIGGLSEFFVYCAKVLIMFCRYWPLMAIHWLLWTRGFLLKVHRELWTFWTTITHMTSRTRPFCLLHQSSAAKWMQWSMHSHMSCTDCSKLPWKPSTGMLVEQTSLNYLWVAYIESNVCPTSSTSLGNLLKNVMGSHQCTNTSNVNGTVQQGHWRPNRHKGCHHPWWWVLQQLCQDSVFLE